jgi:hypothetical protein
MKPLDFTQAMTSQGFDFNAPKDETPLQLNDVKHAVLEGLTELHNQIRQFQEANPRLPGFDMNIVPLRTQDQVSHYRLQIRREPGAMTMQEAQFGSSLQSSSRGLEFRFDDKLKLYNKEPDISSLHSDILENLGQDPGPAKHLAWKDHPSGIVGEYKYEVQDIELMTGHVGNILMEKCFPKEFALAFQDHLDGQKPGPVIIPGPGFEP